MRRAAAPRGGPLGPLVHLGLGAAAAGALAFVPLVRFASWLFRSIVHELGHCAADWFCGAPSIPVISLAGEAMAASQERSTAVSLVAVGVAAAATWRVRSVPLRLGLLAGLALGYPLLVLTPLHTLLRALAGHLAEIGFGCLALHRAWTARGTHGPAERTAYAAAGWTLLGHELLLCAGLAFSAGARSDYAGNGSFGLRNDYLVVADAWLGGQVGLLGFLMAGVVLVAGGATLALAAAGTARRT